MEVLIVYKYLIENQNFKFIRILKEICKHGIFNVTNDSFFFLKKKNNCDHFVHIYIKLRNLYILIKVYKDDKLSYKLLLLLLLLLYIRKLLE